MATGTSTPAITLNVPTASAANRGVLSATDWSAFNGTESALTFSSPLSRSTNTISLGTVGVANGGTGLTTYATGDLLYASAANTLSKLVAGTNDQVLTLAGGVPSWSAATLGSDANQSTKGGLGALSSQTTGSLNTALGYSALTASTDGGSNVAVGAQALRRAVSAGENTAVGMSAGLNLTGGDNTVVGFSAGAGANGGAAGHGNTALGWSALELVSSGNYNVAVGREALRFNSTGSSNVAVGYGALDRNSTGVGNAAVGENALYSNLGSYNCSFGFEALANLDGSSASNNIGIGKGALVLLLTGSNNIAVGKEAGKSLTGSESNNIHIGHTGVTGESAVIRIGTAATHTNAFIAGISGVTSTDGAAVYINASGQLGTVTSSARFKENIQPMADLSSRLFGLRPVTFTYKAEYGGGGLQYGLIAEEVDQVIPEMTVRDKDGQIQTVAYQMLPPMLLNEAQKQQKVIEALQARVEAQQAELDALKAQMAKILARLPQ